MRFVSLFAGIGGFDLGFERAGWDCIGQVELDQKASVVLGERFPHVPHRWTDVQTAKGWADECGLVGRTDLVCGGFPCQDISLAGKRVGLSGDRSRLFWDALEFTQHVGAEWIVLENVASLLSSNGGRDFGVVLLALDAAGFGHIEWRVVDAVEFGLPQRRKRAFIVGCRRSPGSSPLLVDPESVRGDSASGRGEGPAAASGAAGGAEEGGWTPLMDVAGTLAAGAHASGFNGQNAYVGHLVYRDDAVRMLTPTEWERLMGFPDGWTDVGQKDSNRYRQLGNAVCPPVAEYIASCINAEAPTAGAGASGARVVAAT